MEIMVEGHGLWSLPAALKIARALEEFRPAWLEDLMRADDIDALAGTSVDDLVEFLDLSLDEAEVILSAAQAVVAMRDRTLHPETEEAEGEAAATEEIETHAVSSELDESVDAGEVEPSDQMTAEGYDEAVEAGGLVSDSESAEPVAVEGVELSADEIVLQEPGRDLRPDTITPDPDMGATEIAGLDNVENIAAEAMASDEEIASEVEAEEAQTPTPAVSEDAASSGNPDDEKQ